MRKKLSSILIGIMLIFAGVFASACGDKYKNFEFKVSYAFAEDASTWYEAGDEISLNYLVDGNEYVFDINGKEERVYKSNFNLYIKIEIGNVESKYIDSITISAEGSNGLAFDSSTIREGKTVKLGIVGVVNSQLSLYENESGKSKKLNLSIYGKLEDLDFNEDLNPAVVVGENINLNSITDLVYYNRDKGATTNQTGVEYTLLDFGSFADGGIYVEDSAINNQFNSNFVSLSNGKLKVYKTAETMTGQEFELNNSNNVIRLKAESIYNPELYTFIYVYIVPDNLGSPIVTYAEGSKAGISLNDESLLYKGLDLYISADSEADLISNEYSSSKVNLSMSENLYSTTEIKTHNGKTLTLQPVVYVGNVDAYNFDVAGNPVRDLLIEKNGEMFTINLVNRSTEAQVNVKFAYKLVAADSDATYEVLFTNASPNLQTDIIVRKHVLASSILANGEYLKDGDKISGVVYSTSNSSYVGYKLDLSIDPIDQFALEKQTNEITGINNLIVKDENNFSVEEGSKLSSLKTLYFKFKNSINEKQTVSIRTKNTPYYFNGDLFNSASYIQITLELEKKVTADNLEIVEGDTLNAVSSVKVAANKQSNVFIKAYHTGTLDLETVTITSSVFALNGNGDKQLLLQNAEFVSNGEGYSIYKINIPAVGQADQISTLTVFAGELGKGAQAVARMESVNLVTNVNNINVVPKETTYVETLGNNKFAVVRDKEIQFNVVETVDKVNLQDTIKVVSLQSVTVEDTTLASYFGDAKTLKADPVLNSNIFKIQGWENKTRIFNVIVEYYDQIDGVISLQTKSIENVQFAVYNPITSVITNIQKESDGKTVKDSVVYVNQLFSDASMTKVAYASHSGVDDDVPTQKIYFLDAGMLDERTNVSGVQISIDENLSDVTAVKIWYELNSSFSLLDNQQILVNEANINSSVMLQLVSSYAGRLGVTFSFTAKQFGKTTTVKDSATIYFKSVDKADRLDVKGDIHAYSSTDRELQLSFMGVEENEVSKSFTAEPKYSTDNANNDNFKRFNDITYLLYKYTLKDGEIVYESDGVTPKLTQITSINKSLKVVIDGSTVTVTADKTLENIGGLYKLVVATMDSYNDANGTFGTTYSVNVRVSDGSSVDSAYIVTTAEQFLGINNDLDAHYVLGDIITLSSAELTRPIGSETNSVKPFKGSLSGKLHTVTESGFSNISNYSVYVTINKNIQASDSTYLYGLFSVLEGKISNLNIHINLNNIETPEGDSSNIGGVVAVNKGTIENVTLYLSGVVSINNQSNFGGIAALNDSMGIIKNCKIDPLKQSLTINSKIASNIGLVAGENHGEITGRYAGKDSLEQVSYDVIANLTVNNTAENISYNIGGVAGYSTSNISNIIVGGKINVTSKNGADVSVPNLGYLAGIVGETSADLSTVAALGLNLNNADFNGIKVAGIAGKAVNITDARYISAAISFKFGKTIGEIIGSDVAGISFNATVSYSTVESFIQTVNNNVFYTLEAENNAYGLINEGSVTNSFVTANITGTNAYLTSNVSDASKNVGTYFIGQVVIDIEGSRIVNSTYSVVYNNEGFVKVTGFDNNDPVSFVKDRVEYQDLELTLQDYLTKFEGDDTELADLLLNPDFAVYGYEERDGEYVKLATEDDLTIYGDIYVLDNSDLTDIYYSPVSDEFELVDISLSLDTALYSQKTVEYFDLEAWKNNVSLTGFVVDSEYNKISADNYVWFFPYLKDANGNELMILQPTSIEAEINRDYQISTEKNIYVDDVEIEDDATPPTYTISESIIVDFFSFSSLYEDYTNVNKHFLVNVKCQNCKDGNTCTSGGKCHDGLLNLTMLPVTAGLNFEIMGNGVDYASIEDNKYIIFTGASNGEPIIVKVYSVFNADVQVYVAFYSQQTYSKITLNGNNLTESIDNDADYILKSYQGKTGSLISLSGDNIINGTEYASIFANSNMKKYIKIETSYTDSVLNVNADTLSTISVAIKDDYIIKNNGESTNVKFKVWLDKSYFGSVRDADLLLGEVELKVLMYNVAEGLDIIGADTFEIDSSSSVSLQASLKTGLVDLNDSTTDEQELMVAYDQGIIVVKDVESTKVKDSIKMTIASKSEEIAKLLETTGESYIVNLFDFDVYSLRTEDGYTFFITLSLKDEFNYRYITSNINLELQIWADSNDKIQNSVAIVVTPTTVNTTRFANYAVEKIAVISDTKSELTRGNVETSIISPGGRGNILVAHIEKSYSNIDSISITSSELYVPSLGKNVNLMFSQLVYNEKTQKFETLFNADLTEQNGNTLQLQRVTLINNVGKEEYTGLVYIHVQLVKFAGLESTINASLNVVSNGKKLAQTTKTFTTTFLPGADLYYNGVEIADGYLVQEETYQNSAKIKLQGYQFNSNPTMNINWELIDGVDYFYKLDSVNNFVITDTEKIKEVFEADNLYYLEDGKYYKAKYESDCEKTVTFYLIQNKKILEMAGTDYVVTDFVSYYFVKDYTEVEYNSVDGSYTMEVKFNIAKDIPTGFSMQATLNLITKDGQFETAKSDVLKFYPAKYVITDISVANTSGNKKMLAINRTDKFEILFTTLKTDYDYSNEIYKDAFITEDSSNTEKIYIDDLKELFSYYDETNLTFADSSDKFSVAIREGYLNLTGTSKFQSTVTLSVYIGYKLVDGKYKVVFSEGAGDGMVRYDYSFVLQIYPGAGEENATPIYHSYEMFDEEGNCLLAENGHYILMNDLTLELVKPIDYSIGSLDGNNKIIKIKNFVIDASKTHYGLFANIGTYQDEEQRSHKTILKNVIVDYSEFNAENNGNLEFLNNNMTNIVFGGLVAENNGGLIYNSDVINYTAASNKTVNILVDDNAHLTFGAFVGINSGNITNSRVGRSTFTKVDAINDRTTNNIPMGSLTFVLGNDTLSGFNVISGGFVGVNSGNISSSYFANSSLINYSNSKDENLTAGFVGRNSSDGQIMYSYVKAMENTITANVPYATGAKIQGKGNSIIAGFVYENGGKINDCYSNTYLETNATYMAGFVYNNSTGATSGTISECYAACSMKAVGAQDDAEQPFVGKSNEGVYLDNGTIENAYYLISDSGSGEVGSSSAQALNATNFKNSNNLLGFVFVQSNVTAEREQGVWSHIDARGYSVILPELMNANKIANSAKYLVSGNGIEEKFTYTNASSYLEGSQNNPYIIRNIEEFNDIFTGNRTDMSVETSKSGYVRLIDSIDFGEDETAIKTRVKYTLGDSNKANITSFEGNGMSINGIYFDVSEPGISELGLFAKIQNAYVKNVNLNFVKPKTGGQYSTTLVKYSGGLAGIISNSAIINVTLNGSNVSLTGQNFVGGLAGLVEGNSLLYGIKSNLSAVANYNGSNLYYSKADYTALGNTEASYSSYVSNLSYAGGLAGVIDITKRANTDYNIAYIDIYGNEMFKKTSENGVQLANISGQYAGGIAGFASKYSSGLKLKYHVGTTDWISGTVAAGGLFGVSLGTITASQVTADEDIQYGYDTKLGDYIININSKTLDQTTVGNLNLIESSQYAGGLIGVGVNAGINASYSKAGFKDGVIVGGLIGASIASNVTYSYAVPFVNVTDNNKYIGGLIGSAYMVNKGYNSAQNSAIKKYEDLVNLYLKKDSSSPSVVYTDIQYTFSTVIMDKTSLVEQALTWTATDKIAINYIAPSFTNNENVDNIRSGGNTTYTGVYAGTVDYNYSTTAGGEANSNPVSTIDVKAKNRDLDILYNLNDALHESTFTEIFLPWATMTYWSIRHEKYFPLLTNEGVDNYIIIESKEDLKMVESNPDGKYLVVNDIDVGVENSNWLFDCEFTGEFLGQVDSESNERKKLYNIQLTPNTPVDTSGIFRKTIGANISNLEFVFNDGGSGAINTATNGITELTSVAGLSCYDEPDENGNCSEFNNVEVRVGGGGYLIKQPDDKTKKLTINTFAGLIASTASSSINDCSFVGKAQVSLGMVTPDLSDKAVYFGGLVAKASKSANLQDSNMSIMNSKLGANGEDTSVVMSSFEIEIANSTAAYIGGLIAEIHNGSIYSTEIGGVGYPTEYQTIPFDITLSELEDNVVHVGGLVAYNNDSAVNYSNVNSTITMQTNVGQSSLASVYIGGLIGSYVYIANNMNATNAKVDIDVSKLNINTLLASGGVAWLNADYNGAAIKQCLITGDVIAETETDILQASTIVSGGAVATIKGQAKIEETLSTTNVIVGTNSGEAHTLKAGGFVGYVDSESSLEIVDCASTGKLVPICGEAATSVHLGAMIGSVEDSSTAKISNSYTLTSVITDAINGEALAKTSSDALVGYASAGSITVDNTYFSTDITLTTNNKQLGNNLAAVNLVAGEDTDYWKFDFVNSSWKLTEVDQQRVPYIKALEDNLKKYEILKQDSTSGKFDYVLGSVFRPIQNHTELEVADGFTYYIVNSGSNISGTLNGVLIGNDSTIEYASTSVGFITTVSKHSAVSNLHFELVTDKNYTAGGVATHDGIVVETNNGLMFNCSVQGKQINLTINQIGLIAGQNNGTISHSYSSAEIKSTVGKTSGIVYENNGVINTCYFTGYINNNARSAGIVVDSGIDNFVYNSYSAGVIEEINGGKTSFYAGDTALNGLNNRIDQYANIELNINQVDSDGNAVLQSVQTASLMATEGFEGSWYNTVSAGEIIIDAESFGKNYGYPVYKFNKLSGATELTCSDLKYSLSTGTGLNADGEGFASTLSLEDRYNNLIDNEDLYQAAYKIPHLGVLSAVHGLLDVSRNYVVIYDIDGLMTNWTPVGSNNPIQGFVTKGGFNGVFVTNKYLDNSISGTTVEVCSIEGLNGAGLFDQIYDAYFANILLGSFGKTAEGNVGLKNSGPLGKTVTGRTVINNISYLDNSVIEGTDVSALFGDINIDSTLAASAIDETAADVKIAYFNILNSAGTYHSVTLQGGGSAGLIASNMTAGSIELALDTDKNATNNLYPFMKKFTTAGSLVGNMAGGKINGNGHIVNLNLATNNNEKITNLGGLVGKGLGGEVDGFVVNFYKGSETIIVADTFGGFVANVQGYITFNNCSITSATAATEIKFNSQKAGNNGLVVGSIIAGKDGATSSITVNNFNMTKVAKLTFTAGTSDETASIGGIVGSLDGDLNFNYSSAENLTIISTNVLNLGGIIGIYKAGNVNICKVSVQTEGETSGTRAKTSSPLTLQGCKNVGGFIGRADTFPTIVKPEDQDESPINFLTHGSAYAEIIIGKDATENFGGIFGLLKNSNIAAGSTTPEAGTSSNDELTKESFYEVVNNNVIKFEELETSVTDKSVSNIGGVVGRIEGEETLQVGNMTNKSKFEITQKKYNIKNIGGVVGQFKGTLMLGLSNEGEGIKIEGVATSAISNAEDVSKPYSTLMNVGGVVGLIISNEESAITVSKLTNSAIVQGYQNVGGLIGYVSNATIQGNITINAAAAASASSVANMTLDKNGSVGNATIGAASVTNNVTGVINVGGAIGCAEQSTIQQIFTSASAFGNVNVGGLIGLSNENTIENNYVGLDAGADKVEISGVYYNYYFKSSGASNTDYVSYIPTSVGGLLGISVESMITSNIVNNVNITSAKEGEETGKAIANSKGMISTIKNYMVAVGSGEGSVGIDNLDSYSSRYILGGNGTYERKVEYKNIESGFGGFVGTIGELGFIDSEKPSYMRNINIEASLGVNVGTYYGTFVYDSNGFKAPVLFENVIVNGGYNIGGIAGKLSSDSVEAFSNANLTGSGTINLQPNLTGMYIGGLFGEVQSNNVKGLTIENGDIEIQINTGLSYYIGGLVGKLTVNSANTFVGTATSVKVIGDPAQNFGGLVGMLKINSTSGGEYKVNGKHNFAFTVNTIENQNYDEGKSQFDTALYENEGYVQLLAQAYYINKDSFNISATSQTSFYEASAKNPLRSDSQGWAKEYTGFKQVQRCIAGGSANGADSIAFVYNAENITHVSTLLNSGLKVNDPAATYCSPDCATEHTHSLIRYGKPADSSDSGNNYYYKGDSGWIKMSDQFIIYTVYEKEYGYPMMYTPIGIAEVAKMQDGTLVTSSSSVYNESQEDLKGDTTSTGDGKVGLTEYYWERSVMDKTFAGTSSEGIPLDKAYASLGSIQNLLRFDWKDKVGEDNIVWYYDKDGDGKMDQRDKKDGLTNAYYYTLDGKFYDFKVIYANSTLASAGATPTVNLTQDLACPKSGSVFEISGINPDFDRSSESYTSTSDWKWWHWLLAGIGLAILIALIVVSIVFSAGAATGFWAGLGAVLTASAGGLSLTLLITLGAIALAIAMFSQIGAQGTVQSMEFFYSTHDQNLGLLTTTTTTQIRYENNKLSATGVSTKKVIDTDGRVYEYQYYSTERPSDYYTNHFIALATVTGDVETTINSEKSLTIGVSYAELDSDIDGDGNLIFARTDATSGNECVYGYHYGTSALNEINAYKKYIFSEGVYYFNNMAYKWDYYQTQELTNFDNVKFNGEELTEAGKYTTPEGRIYVRGTYDSTTGTYTYNSFGGNLMKNDYTLNGVGLGDAAYYDVPLEFVYTGSDTDEDQEDGYNYMVGAYYTANGIVNNDAVKYATFTGSTTKPADFEQYDGANYLSYNYTWQQANGTDSDGNTIYETKSQTWYYTISSIATDPGSTSYVDKYSVTTSVNSSADINSTLYIKIYPKSFINPYKGTISNSTDSKLYVHETLDNSSGKFKISHTVRYFYFENGYKLGEDLDGVESGFAKSVFVESSITTDWKNETIDLYNSSGTKTSVSYKTLFMNSEGTAFASSVNSTYLDYYRVDPTTDTGNAMKDLYKVRNSFVIDGGILYERNDMYSLKNGSLHKLYIYNTQSDSESYNKNKYLSNSQWGLFTMFRYNGAGNFKFSKEDKSVWVDEAGNNYYIIPLSNNATRPNNLETYLVETGKVTLGGGLTLNHTGGGSGPSGRITIEDYQDN